MSNNTYSSVWLATAKRQCSKRGPNREMADISAFRRLTDAHTQHLNTLSDTHIHTHIYTLGMLKLVDVEGLVC